MRLSAIYVYPIKSLGGISLQEATVEERGLHYDRRWMLTDPEGHFITQRQYPELALFRVNLQQDGLEVTHKSKPLEPLSIGFEEHPDPGPPGNPGQAKLPAAGRSEELSVTVWHDTCRAREVSPAASDWFSEALQMPVRLVHMPDSTRRRVDTRYAHRGEIVGFADGYPFLLIGQASLDDLNSRLPAPLPMNRFRPNLVFKGGEAFCEDTFDAFTIGELAFRTAKPCARCVMTTIDQDSASRSPEPLRTLSSYRRQGNKILFGQNLLHIPAGPATIKVGEELQVQKWKIS